jgi:hypothetical protein
VDQIHTEVSRLYEAAEDDLYSDIGAAVGGKHAFPPSRRALIDLGKGWFNSKRGALESLICKNEHLRRVSRQDVPTHEKVVAVCGLLDLGGHELGAAPVVTVAVLVVRLGLHQFCATHWQEQGTE